MKYNLIQGISCCLSESFHFANMQKNSKSFKWKAQFGKECLSKTKNKQIKWKLSKKKKNENREETIAQHVNTTLSFQFLPDSTKAQKSKNAKLILKLTPN